MPGRSEKGVGWAEVAHGCHVSGAVLGHESVPWETRRAVAEARIRAVHRQMSRHGEPLFTGESGLVARGLPTWWDNPDVTVRRPRRSSQPVALKPVCQGEVCVSGVRVRQVAAAPSYEEVTPERVNELYVAPAALTLVDLCRESHAAQAFYGASVLLDRLAGFDRFKFDESQARLSGVRRRLAEELLEYRGLRAVPRARALVECVPVGFDSPAEAVVAWLVLAMLSHEAQVVSQFPVSTPSGPAFIDVALPDYKIALEISGVGKFDETGEGRDRVTRFLVRQQDLLDAGWLSINIRAEEVFDLLSLARTLYQRLQPRGVPIGEPRGVLW